MTNLRHRSAGIVIREGKILLMRRFKGGEEYYIFPGGGIEAGETPEEAVTREFLEETQVTISIQSLLYQISYDSGEYQYYYLCEYVSGIPALRPDSIEFEKTLGGLNTYEPLWIDLSEVDGLRLYPFEIRDILVGDLKGGFPEETRRIPIRVVDIRR